MVGTIDEILSAVNLTVFYTETKTFLTSPAMLTGTVFWKNVIYTVLTCFKKRSFQEDFLIDNMTMSYEVIMVNLTALIYL